MPFLFHTGNINEYILHVWPGWVGYLIGFMRVTADNDLSLRVTLD